MNFDVTRPNTNGGGICVWEQDLRSFDQTANDCQDWLAQRGMSELVEYDIAISGPRKAIRFALRKEKIDQLAPGGDTLQLAERLSLVNRNQQDLKKEILVAMLASPIVFEFPSIQELESHINVRCNIVNAATKTFLSFAAYDAERPIDYWEYDSERGFVVRRGKCLIEALRNATQPAAIETAYSFSCYRATEYIVALSLAEEASVCNRELLNSLQLQAETRAIKSGEFHSVFMKEYGSRENPLPARYYVPGDRVWFRNPDAASSNAIGFEGSWVFYQGGGLFSDFWKRNQAFTLQSKSLEIFHWRNATYRDNDCEVKIDEKVVQTHVQSSLKSTAEVREILRSMEKIQDPRGVYSEGGCIDPSREYPKWVRPCTTDIVLPDVNSLRHWNYS